MPRGLYRKLTNYEKNPSFEAQRTAYELRNTNIFLVRCARVYIVSFRTHDTADHQKFIVLADKYASGHARIRTHPTYSLIAPDIENPD